MKVIFCVSGRGTLMKEAVIHKSLIGVDAAVCIAEDKSDISLEKFCSEHGVTFFRINSANRLEFDARLEQICFDAKADLIALTFDKLLSKKLVEAYRNKIINAHLALLPSFKGFSALQKARNAGVTIAGATIHIVDEGMDSGPILVQTAVPVDPFQSAADIGDNIFTGLRHAWLQAISWFSQGRVSYAEDGRPYIQGALYESTLICPSIEIDFPKFNTNI